MGLVWIRLNTTMPDHPKVLALLDQRNGHRAAFVWVACMCYAGKHDTGGFVPKGAIGGLAARTVDMAQLVGAGLAESVDGGWELTGWDEYQVSDATAKARKASARKAAEVRWADHRRRRAMGES